MSECNDVIKKLENLENLVKAQTELINGLAQELQNVNKLLKAGGDVTFKKDDKGNVSYEIKPHLNFQGRDGEDEPRGV